MSIQIQNLSVSFGGRQILTDFSLTLPDRGVVCVFGPSGCGKTTLFRCLLGLVPPDGGQIEGIAGKRLSVVFQEDRLLPWTSALDNVALVLAGDRELARKHLRDMELEADMHKLPEELSGGMRRRVAIARALAYGGDLLFLDEPSTGLDEELADRVMEKLTRSRQERLILLITHERALAQRYADKIIGIPVK